MEYNFFALSHILRKKFKLDLIFKALMEQKAHKVMIVTVYHVMILFNMKYNKRQ
jgi:hypothetical protein